MYSSQKESRISSGLRFAKKRESNFNPLSISWLNEFNLCFTYTHGCKIWIITPSSSAENDKILNFKFSYVNTEKLSRNEW